VEKIANTILTKNKLDCGSDTKSNCDLQGGSGATPLEVASQGKAGIGLDTEPFDSLGLIL
jgi:hypothetical protein